MIFLYCNIDYELKACFYFSCKYCTLDTKIYKEEATIFMGAGGYEDFS